MKSRYVSKTAARRLLREMAAAAGLPYTRVGDDVCYIGSEPIFINQRDIATVESDGHRAVEIGTAPTQLAAYMLRTGKTYADLAAMTGISRGLLHKYATGKVHPGPENHQTIYEATSVDEWPTSRNPGRPRKEVAA